MTKLFLSFLLIASLTPSAFSEARAQDQVVDLNPYVRRMRLPSGVEARDLQVRSAEIGSFVTRAKLIKEACRSLDSESTPIWNEQCIVQEPLRTSKAIIVTVDYFDYRASDSGNSHTLRFVLPLSSVSAETLREIETTTQGFDLFGSKVARNSQLARAHFSLDFLQRSVPTSIVDESRSEQCIDGDNAVIPYCTPLLVYRTVTVLESIATVRVSK